MDYFEPEIINGNYIFEEEVNGGYGCRSSCYYYKIITKWSKDLKLIFFEIGRENWLPLFTKEGKIKYKKIKCREKLGFNSFHYHRAIRAHNRHLKYLRIYLKLDPTEQDKKKTFIYRRYYDSELMIQEIKLTKKGTPNFKEISCQSCPIVEVTPEKIKLVEEYNKKINEWNKERNKLFDKIFKEKENV